MGTLFNEQSYERILSTEIIHVDIKDGVNLVEVRDCIFHPHGGGQKGDRGVLACGDKEIKVTNTIRDKATGRIYIVLENAFPEAVVGSPVESRLDWDYRYRQMRLHTTVHLHHCALETVVGKTLKPPKTSDIQDGFAFNRYDGQEVNADIVELANQALRNMIAQGGKVHISPEPGKTGFYWWECLGKRIPCGGTHVADVSEIGDLEIKYSTKKGKPTINFVLK